jgi:hypothetical protein
MVSCRFKSKIRLSQSINVFNICDYGAVAGQVCDDAIARALAASIRFPSAILYIPAADLPYYITRTIWITRSNLIVRGDGREVSRIAAKPGYNAHMIVAAINVNVPGGIPTADHFVSLDGFGDGTLAGCQGIRLGTDQIFASWSGPLDQPMPYLQANNRGWSDFPQITLSILLDDRGKPLPVGPICGIGESFPHGYQFRPYQFLNIGDGWLEFRFMTRDIASKNNNYRSFLLSEGVPSGCKEFSLYLDLLNCRALAYRNKSQVDAYPFVNMGPKSSRSNLIPFEPGDNLRLAENVYHPFMFGGDGSNTQGRGAGPVMDLTVGGFALSKGMLYADDGVGKPQRALDGAPVTDSYLVRPPVSSLMGRLAIEEIKPTNPLGGRDIPIYIGGACARGWGVTSGLLSPVGQQVNCNLWLSNHVFRDFSLSGSGWYGDLLCLGGMYYLTVERMYLDGGYCNIGSTRMGPSTYPFKQNDLLFGSSFGASYLGHTHITDAQGYGIATAFRTAITMASSSLVLRNAFINRSVNKHTIACYVEDNGGNYKFIDIATDNEGDVTPTEAMFLIEVPWNQRASLVIDGVTTGTMAPRAAVVELKRVEGHEDQHYPVSIKNIKVDQAGVIIRTDHSDISGEIIADTANEDDYPWLELTGGISTTNLTIRSLRYPVPPSRLQWTDTAILEVRRAVVGMPEYYRCIQGGEYGTANLPLWSPGPIHADGESVLGAYSTNSEFITAPVNQINSAGGHYSDWARNALLDYWLRGVPIQVPTGLKLQLSIYMHNYLDLGYPYLPYADVDGMFTDSRDGKTTNTADITFSLPKYVDYKTNSVLLLDSANHLIWESRLSAELACLQTGPAARIIQNALSIAGRSAGGSDGGFTDYALIAEADHWHTGKALPTMDGRYLGLSVEPAQRSGVVCEPSGYGYARVPLSIDDFSAASQGRSATTRPISFQDVTGGDWPAVQSVFVADALQGGKILWHENLIKPRIARLGQPPLRFERGALVIVK